MVIAYDVDLKREVFNSFLNGAELGVVLKDVVPNPECIDAFFYVSLR